MPGRQLLSDIDCQLAGFTSPGCRRRRQVLRETLTAFARAAPPDHYHQVAAANLARWQAQAPPPSSRLQVTVLAGDWGEVTGELTGRYGQCFAVLNMANAEVAGGAYVEGAVAQEENMFRRTDCHFRVDEASFDRKRDRYRPQMTALLNAAAGRVYLDAKNPRVCVRGAEDRGAHDLGYRWLAADEIFPFYELRAAARDLRGGLAFSATDARRRIAAQLDTLREAGLRYAVLGAFGCGAFQNPAAAVASLYREAIACRAGDFDILAFAIFNAGYGPDNFTPFAREFAGFDPE